MAATHYQKTPGRQVRHASITSSQPGQPDHTTKLTSRCNCAHNIAHDLARSAILTGWTSTVQTWTGAFPIGVETTVYSPDDKPYDLDLDELSF